MHKKLLLLLPLAALYGCDNASHSTQQSEIAESMVAVAASTDDASQLSDSWESVDFPDTHILECQQIEYALIRDIDPSFRDETIRTLSEDSFVQLSDEQAARLINEEVGSGGNLATHLVTTLLTEMEKRKYRAQVERSDSWSGRDQQDFESMTSRLEARAYEGFQPYLVRAVAKHEGTGAFFADLCENNLRVVHGSLGHRVPPSTRVPIVIFLEQQPDRVFVTWSMAQ